MTGLLVRFAKVFAAVSRMVRTFLDTLWMKFRFLMAGVRFGRHCKALGVPFVRVSLGGKAVIGDCLYWRTGASNTEVGGVGSRLIVGPVGVLSIGSHVGLSNATVVCHQAVTIGNYVNIGGGVQIFDTDFHSLDPSIRNSCHEDRHAVRTKPVSIGDGCFLGANAMICKGVSIGDNAIIGAGAVVVCNVPAGEVWGGNPARKIR